MSTKIDNLPEIFLSNRPLSTAITRAARSGLVRKIGPRLYTRNLRDTPEAIIARTLWQTIALLAPGAVVSHRTAFETGSRRTDQSS